MYLYIQMLINDKTIPGLDPDKLFADGLVYLHTSQWLLAYTVFAHLYGSKKDKSVSLGYNMALCHIFSKEYSRALAVLEEAQMQLAAPSVSFQSAGNWPAELLVQEYENDNYRFALSETAVALNMAIVKLRIRRLMVDLQLELQNWPEVIRLCSLPEMEKCKNVMEALARAKTNINTSKA